MDLFTAPRGFPGTWASREPCGHPVRPSWATWDGLPAVGAGPRSGNRGLDQGQRWGYQECSGTVAAGMGWAPRHPGARGTGWGAAGRGGGRVAVGLAGVAETNRAGAGGGRGVAGVGWGRDEGGEGVAGPGRADWDWGPGPAGGGAAPQGAAPPAGRPHREG